MKSLGVINLPGDRSTYSFTLSNSGADQITAFRDTDNSIDALLVRQLHHRMVEGRGLRLPIVSDLGQLNMLPTQWATTDRKSTRLNSSHLGISYAVFCL